MTYSTHSSNATVHAIGNITVNGSSANVSGDSDFNIIVSDTKTTALANFSAGATVNVNNFNVISMLANTFIASLIRTAV